MLQAVTAVSLPLPSSRKSSAQSGSSTADAVLEKVSNLVKSVQQLSGVKRLDADAHVVAYAASQMRSLTREIEQLLPEEQLLGVAAVRFTQQQQQAWQQLFVDWHKAWRSIDQQINLPAIAPVFASTRRIMTMIHREYCPSTLGLDPKQVHSEQQRVQKTILTLLNLRQLGPGRRTCDHIVALSAYLYALPLTDTDERRQFVLHRDELLHSAQKRDSLREVVQQINAIEGINAAVAAQEKDSNRRSPDRMQLRAAYTQSDHCDELKQAIKAMNTSDETNRYEAAHRVLFWLEQAQIAHCRKHEVTLLAENTTFARHLTDMLTSAVLRPGLSDDDMAAFGCFLTEYSGQNQCDYSWADPTLKGNCT